MFATRLSIATLVLSGILAAQQAAFEGALPASQSQQPGTSGEIDVAIEGPASRPGAPDGMARWRFAEPGSVQFATQEPAAAPAGGGQVILGDPAEASVHAEGLEPQPLQLAAGVSMTRCGVTVSNLAGSGDAVLLSPAGAGCFTSIEVGDGTHAAIEVADGAWGLESLQVTVMGRAFLEVSGAQGLGEYDLREPLTCKAGIVVDGAGITASDQDEPATITLKSSRNVVQTLGASTGHEIRIEGESNLVRLGGGDQVLSHALDTRVLWMAQVFLL